RELSGRTLEKLSPSVAPLAAPALRTPVLESLSSSTILDRPTLNLQTGLAISWPATYTGYVLEQTSSLSSTNWERVTNAVGVVNQVILPAPSGDRFYRLSTA